MIGRTIPIECLHPTVMPNANWKFRTIFLLQFICAVALSPGRLHAEPLIFFRAIVNAASFMPPDGPGGSIARGSIFTIFGRDIGPVTPAQVNAFPLETTFQGVSIEVTQGNVTVNAIPIFVWDRQVNAIMPSGAPLGQVLVRLSFSGEQSNPTPMTIAENSVGIFTATGAGIGPGIFQNFISQTEQPFNTPSNTARPGQVVTMWATGLGPIAGPDSAAPPVGSLPFDVEIFVGGKAVTKLLYAGRAPCCSGVDQFVFETPADSPEGCYVPVQARVGGSAVSNTVTMAIQKDGAACSEPDNPFMQTFLGGGAIGAITLARTLIESDVDVLSPSTFTVDQAGGYFRQETGGVFAFNPFFALPPAGACTAYSRSGNLLAGIPIPFVPAVGLDAGELSLNGPNGAAELLRTVTGDSTDYDPTLVGGPEGISEAGDEPLYLSPGKSRRCRSERRQAQQRLGNVSVSGCRGLDQLSGARRRSGESSRLPLDSRPVGRLPHPRVMAHGRSGGLHCRRPRSSRCDGPVDAFQNGPIPLGRGFAST